MKANGSWLFCIKRGLKTSFSEETFQTHNKIIKIKPESWMKIINFIIYYEKSIRYTFFKIRLFIFQKISYDRILLQKLFQFSIFFFKLRKKTTKMEVSIKGKFLFLRLKLATTKKWQKETEHLAFITRLLFCSLYVFDQNRLIQSFRLISILAYAIWKYRPSWFGPKQISFFSLGTFGWKSRICY